MIGDEDIADALFVKRGRKCYELWSNSDGEGEVGRITIRSLVERTKKESEMDPDKRSGIRKIAMKNFYRGESAGLMKTPEITSTRHGMQCPLDDCSLRKVYREVKKGKKEGTCAGLEREKGGMLFSEARKEKRMRAPGVK